MVKKTGLGKGLDALFSMPIAEEEQPKTGDELRNLKIIDIEPNRNQARKIFDQDSLQELADSIKMYGVIQPIVVTEQEGYFSIIAGERRWRAAKIAGLKHIPVVIKDYSEQEMVEIALIENIQRQDLNPIEEAMAFKQLMQEYDLKQDELAERVSKSRTAVTNSMRLLKLPQKIMEMVINNELSSGHARTLLSIEDEDLQIKVAELVILKQMSVRETENYVKKLQNNKNKSKDTKNTDNDFVYRDIENKIKEIVGTKVKVNHKNNGKGKIEIEFYSDDELERIYDLFLKTQN